MPSVDHIAGLELITLRSRPELRSRDTQLTEPPRCPHFTDVDRPSDSSKVASGCWSQVHSIAGMLLFPPTAGHTDITFHLCSQVIRGKLV